MQWPECPDLTDPSPAHHPQGFAQRVSPGPVVNGEVKRDQVERSVAKRHVLRDPSHSEHTGSSGSRSEHLERRIQNDGAHAGSGPDGGVPTGTSAGVEGNGPGAEIRDGDGGAP